MTEIQDHYISNLQCDTFILSVHELVSEQHVVENCDHGQQN